MSFSLTNAGLFLLAALVLLGSPGPAIAALVAIGQGQGLKRGLRFFGGLQIGLALAAAFSAVGLFSVLQAFPSVLTAMTTMATGYLVYVGYKIASAPVRRSSELERGGPDATPLSGFILGLSNPKAYMAFVTLMASSSIVESDASVDAGLKWLLCVIVMISVDLVWLWIGASLRQANFGPPTERALNVAMGASIFGVALFPFTQWEWI